MKSTGNLLQFIFTQKAGAGPAQYTVLFLQIGHATLLFCTIKVSDYRAAQRIQSRPACARVGLRVPKREGVCDESPLGPEIAVAEKLEPLMARVRMSQT